MRATGAGVAGRRAGGADGLSHGTVRARPGLRGAEGDESREQRPGCGRTGEPSGRLWCAERGGGGRFLEERCALDASVLLSRVRLAVSARQPRSSVLCAPKTNRGPGCE